MEPLSMALDGCDPLTLFAKQQEANSGDVDPLSRIAADEFVSKNRLYLYQFKSPHFHFIFLPFIGFPKNHHQQLPTPRRQPITRLHLQTGQHPVVVSSLDDPHQVHHIREAVDRHQLPDRR